MDMKNTEATKIIGTIRSTGAKDVEYVKKCVVCGATLLVEQFEIQKDRHEMCGWTGSEELRFQAEERSQIAEFLR